MNKKQKLDIARIIGGIMLIIAGYLLAVFFDVDYGRNLRDLIIYIIPLFVIMTGLEMLRKSIKFHIRCYQAKNWKKIKEKSRKKHE